MDCVERSQGPSRRDLAGLRADRRRHFPKLASRPYGADFPFRVSELRLTHRAELPQAVKRARRLNQGQPRGYQSGRRRDHRFNFWTGSIFEDRPQDRGGVQIKARGLGWPHRSPRTSLSRASAAPAAIPSPFAFHFHWRFGSLARVISPRSASESRRPSSEFAAAHCRRAGRSSATTSSRSVTKTVSPPRTSRRYSESFAFSCLTPTDF